jgi:hypothetical protein
VAREYASLLAERAGVDLGYDDLVDVGLRGTDHPNPRIS